MRLHFSSGSRAAATLAALLTVGGAAKLVGADAEPAAVAATKVPAMLQELRSLNTVATILHVGAHPDDENTQLITYFSRGRGYRTAYLSLTRGDGGQNEIGPEFDEKLGVARTQELLAARRLDGGRQFFTRAIDFGFSKTPEETLAFWNRQEVLGDVVRIIRQFRPDVIVTRFPPPPGSGGHGHHTASAILAVEAFKLAGDPTAYPEQLKEGLSVWQPKRVVWNGSGFSRGGGVEQNPTVKVDIGGNDPVTGEAFGQIAARSRGMHITQGFSGFAGRGSSGPHEESFIHLGGQPAEKDLFDGVDTTWSRFSGGSAVGAALEKIIAEFRADNAAASVPALLAVRRQLRAMGATPAEVRWSFDQPPAGNPRLETSTAEPVLDDKLAQLDRIVCECLGLKVETTATSAEIVPGERFGLTSRVSVQSAVVPITWRFTAIGKIGKVDFEQPRRLQPGKPEVQESKNMLPAETPLTQPYWLREDPQGGIARVADHDLIGRPENPPAVPVGYDFEIGGEEIQVLDEPVVIATDARGEHRRRIDVIPPVSLGFPAEVSLFGPGETRSVAVDVTSARAQVAGMLRLELPAGWTATPASQPFRLSAAGDKTRLVFQVSAPATPATARFTAAAEIGGHRYASQRVVIDYAHLPRLLLQPAARARLVSVPVATRGQTIGYLSGAGDDTAKALEQLGYKVTLLTGADLTAEKLASLDAVVIGVRAFNERKDLASNLPALFSYVEKGGTVVAQYNRPANSLPPLGPYELSIQGPAPALRVTDEKAPVTFLAPEHPALTTPNRITTADFEGWVQERGAYFASKWDEQRYRAILAMNDPGEAPLNSSLLIAQHGKGYYVYTGLAFFRQLPAGVPGAYRLFANLVSLGK
jgi:LmbE family N-acetylglucosaminyl deacetylase